MEFSIVKGALLVGLCAGCGGTVDGPDGEGTGGSGGETSTGGSTATGGDGGDGSSYERTCQPDDFICDDWGCIDSWGATREGECYKRCTPDAGAVGETSADCDEPERPYCGQVGDSLGGDYDCNRCHHLCVAEPSVNQCDQPSDACGP